MTDPVGPSTGSARVLRGGSWLDFRNGYSSSSYDSFYPEVRAPYPVVTMTSPALMGAKFSVSVSRGQRCSTLCP